MRLIVLLIALVLVGLLVARQLNAPGTDTARTQTGDDGEGPPRVPSKPQDVDAFEEDMNRFMDETNEQRQQRLEEETGR